MNLGDGLLFELENGKPRLVLAKNGAESKSSNPQKPTKSSCQIPAKKNPQRIINTKLTQPDKPKQDKKYKDAPSIGYTGQNVTDGHRKTDRSEKIQSEKNRNDSSANQNLVCLTQKQFQQILSTINNTTNNRQNTAEPVISAEEKCRTAATAEELFLSGSNDRQRLEKEKRDAERLSRDDQFGLFGRFGVKELEDAAQKKTQWRRELDEQMALKRKQNGSIKSHDKVREGILEEHTVIGRENSNPKAGIQTYRELPAAIRSAFIPGEAAPLDDAFSAQRSEQQKQWLHELNQQREEAKLRKQREKEMDNQVEDIEQWAVHFDSLRQSSSMATDHREPNMSSLSHQRCISGALSTTSDGISVYGGENQRTATLENQQRTSYLRTMTALLDPAQIEERERQRLKQVEHQQAVKAQVEERRRQREKEEASQRAHEEEEEKRIERERERLQQQFMKDTERQRHKEELQLRKTEELYQSIQRAQEEAFKEKHLQRIKDLAKKGHDVSRLLHSLEGDSVSQAFSLQESPDTSLLSSEGPIRKVEPYTTQSPRKDIAVQTEVRHLSETGTVCDPPDAAVTHMETPNICKNSKLINAKPSERNHVIENTADPYEPYARTNKNHKQQPKKKPEWNMQRPSKAFIPASERYPEALQQNRQKNRKHRQMELMMMMEKNTTSQTPQQDHLPPPIINNHRSIAHKQSLNQPEEPLAFNSERVFSPSVKKHPEQSSHHIMEKHLEDPGRSPSLDYVPYVRTDEVYHMDPTALISRPSTHEKQHKVIRSRQTTPLLHDPSHPKGTERQQAILKGLSELRQGLLQKQREIESSLNPLLQTQQKNLPPFQHA